MRTYFDSSALAKRYVAEAGSDHVASACRKATEILLSVIAVPEILSGLNRHLRDGRLSRRQYESLKIDVAADVAEAAIIDLDANVIRFTVRCLEKAAIRTLDAIHVASALSVDADLFVSADVRQCRAAKEMGLTVVQV